MGYRVKAKAPCGRWGYVQRGSLAPSWGSGTYYPNPCHALRAAKSWVQRHPGGEAHIVDFKTDNVIEVIK